MGLIPKRARIKLGDKARDSISGFSGTVVAITEWLNGCRRLTLSPTRLKEDGNLLSTETFDAEQVELVKPEKTKPVTKTGGPKPAATRNTDVR